MPYRYAHFFVGVVLLVILAGFWSSYFRVIGSSPFAFHFHAFAATSWLLLLIAQSIAIHRRHVALHRTMGKASFALFPLLIVGFVLIINVSASRFAAAEPGSVVLGPAFGIGMVVAMFAYLTLFYNALRHRRNVKLHAGYMLATPVILFESPFSRVIGNYLPGLNLIGSEGPRAVLDTIVISNAIMIAFVLVLYLRDRPNGAPWLVAMAFVGLQSAAMWTAHSWPLIGPAFAAYAALPPALTILTAAMLAVIVTLAGWQNGKPIRRASAALPA